MLTNFGKEVRILRINRGLNLKDMASQFGSASSYISNIETGRVNIPSTYIEKLTKILNLDDEEVKKLTELKRQEDLERWEAGFEGLSEERKDILLRVNRKITSLNSEQLEKIQKVLES